MNQLLERCLSRRCRAMSVGKGCFQETKREISVIKQPSASSKIGVLLEKAKQDKSPTKAVSHPELYCLRFWAFLLVFAHHFLGRYQESIVGLTHVPLVSRLITAVFD